MGEKHDALKAEIYEANRGRNRRRHGVLKARVYGALDAAVFGQPATPYRSKTKELEGEMARQPASVSLLLDTPCDMVNGALGPPRSDESLELRHDYVYEWAKDRGVEIRI